MADPEVIRFTDGLWYCEASTKSCIVPPTLGLASVSWLASKYNVTNIVYFEIAETAEAAIAREKQLKAGPRRRKIELIKSMNPTWRDLSVDL